jgi:hypothetical protein
LISNVGGEKPESKDVSLKSLFEPSEAPEQQRGFVQGLGRYCDEHQHYNSGTTI